MHYKYLEARPDRASGELTIKGTRIRIAQVINMLANGHTLAQMYDGWPWLSAATLKGAIEEAAELLSVSGMRKWVKTVAVKIRTTKGGMRMPPDRPGPLWRHPLRRALHLEFALHPITLAFNDDGLGMVQEPIE